MCMMVWMRVEVVVGFEYAGKIGYTTIYIIPIVLTYQSLNLYAISYYMYIYYQPESYSCIPKYLFDLFNMILYVTSTIFQI